MSKRIVFLSVVAALAVSGTAPASADAVDFAEQYADAVDSSATENQGYETSNTLLVDNIACVETPWDPATGKFRGSGAGTPQTTVERVDVHAVDQFSFQGACSTPDGPSFTMWIDYWVDVQDPWGNWNMNPDTAYTCGPVSSAPSSTTVKAASIQVPGTPTGCPFEHIYPLDDPSLGTMHRLHTQVYTRHFDSDLGQFVTRKRIEGVSIPWPALCLSGNCFIPLL